MAGAKPLEQRVPPELRKDVAAALKRWADFVALGAADFDAIFAAISALDLDDLRFMVLAGAVAFDLIGDES